ncbi:MAG: exosortase B [Rubrivivax sp.]|nr:MAG: exosortase B [Rubrivivax sp.]
MNTQTLALPIDSNSPSKLELGALALGLLSMYIPTYINLDQNIWNIVGQGHGPVMLALTLWLGWQRWPKVMALPDRRAAVAGTILLTFGILLYVVGHSQDLLSFEAASQIPVLAGLFLFYKGGAGLKTMWFPLFFLLFLIPLPGSIVDAATAPLKAGVSYVAEWALHSAGYPIGRSGVTLTIGQYQLLVADACAGINSIFALEAIGVFYLSMAAHTNRWRNIALATLIIPISFVSNTLRVMILVLVTYYFGDEAGQGFVHGFAGILLFMVATMLTIGVDAILGKFFKEPPAPPQATAP